jgi:hypothetical protein
MDNWVKVLWLVAIVFAYGCSSETAKRTAYETLQNVREQECLTNPAMECGKRESYDDYQRKRAELEPSN